MHEIQIIIAGITSVILFVFGLEHFSKEIQKISGENFRRFIGRATKYNSLGLLIGTLVTSIIQSSSATSVIAISLVNAGVLSFKSSVGIIFGANIGTTVTAQLVAFKLTAFAPAFIIIGFLLSFAKSKYTIFAKSIFYFGFVFFTLNLISSTMSPLQDDPRIVDFLTGKHGPIFGILLGIIVTAVVQSSSVTTGLAVIFTQQGLMSLDNAIPILMGANIGTTVTALISIINMDIAAKKTALAHFLFNVGGVVLFLPLVYFGKKYIIISVEPAIALAYFHLIFNISTSLVFLLLIKPFTTFIDRILGEGSMDFERLDLSFIKKTEVHDDAEQRILENEKLLFAFIQENYNQVTLSIETNYKKIFETAKKRIEYIDFVRGETLGFFANIISNTNEDNQIKRYLSLINRYEYLYQLHDSVKDLTTIKEAIDKNYIEIGSDLLLLIRELTGETLSLFTYIWEEFNNPTSKEDLKVHAQELQEEINKFNRSILKLMAQHERPDIGAVFHLVTYSQRLKDKLVNYHKIVIQMHESDLVLMEKIKVEE